MTAESSLEIPADKKQFEFRQGRKVVKLTNLDKVFWPKDGTTKGDLLRYYAAVAPWLLPHLKDRAMVMKRYPNGVEGEHFFMKRAPANKPGWIETCSIRHSSGNVIHFPKIQDLPSLLWVINLGCIDLNQWYARCDDVDKPDYLHFDLDPTAGTPFARVRETALRVHDALDVMGMPTYAKTTGSRGIHIYVPIVRNVDQKEVWGFAKEFGRTMAQAHPDLITAEYAVAKRPNNRVLVDYNQNAWGRTLASLYSPRPRPLPTVSMPVSWEDIEGGVEIEDFTLRNVPELLARDGDRWKPLLERKNRFNLRELLDR